MEEDMRNLHYLLKELHANELQGHGRCREGRSQSIAKMNLGHLIGFSNVLFEELVRQSEYFNALLKGPSDGASDLDSMARFTKEGFIALLRCCLTMLQFLEFDMSFLREKCGVLFKILGEFFPRNLALNSRGCSVVSTRNSSSHCCSYFLGGIDEEDDQLLNFCSVILEVFISEFSANSGLMKHLISVNALAASSEKLCECRDTHADGCIILTLVFSHFLQEIRNGLNFSRFLHSLSGSSEIDRIIPEISLDNSLKLISTPSILSAPLILQAHLILLASRCISTLPIEGRRSETPLMSCYINPLELSVDLYLSYLSALQLDGVILGAKDGSNLGGSTVHRMTSAHQVYDFVDSSYLHSESKLSGTKAEVMAYSSSYIRANHPLIDQLCKEATCLVVDYMIKSIIPMEAWEHRADESRERIQQEVYCLAAAMKLMNSSLVHIICLLRHAGSQNRMTALRDSLPYMAYECVFRSASIIRGSGCRTDRQVREFLYDMLGAYGGMHQEIKFMLAHISSLLLFSFERKIDFLWKACISMMMTLMNLLLLEERSLGMSKMFENLRNPPLYYQGLTYRSTSLIIAKNLEKSRMIYLKNEIKHVHVEKNRTDNGERSEIQGNTCNGERFAECYPSYHTNPSDWENLIDFIECSPEKDYFSWIKSRNKFNKWKQEKCALIKRQKKKKKKKKKKKTHVKRVYNLRPRVDTSKGVEVKSQGHGSRHKGQRGA